MKRFFVGLFLVWLFFNSNAQVLYPTDLPNPKAITENFVQKIYSDSLTTSFFIRIPKQVKPHKHELHTEQVFVIKGTGLMTLGDSSFTIEKGMFLVIPKGKKHQVIVTSTEPLEIISIQAPEFDGTDRIWIDEK